MKLSEIRALRTVFADCVGDTEGWSKYLGEALTINECLNGRLVAWCIWSEGLESCRYVDTLERLTDNEIQKQLW